MGRDVIIACDFPNKEETLAFLDKLGDRRPYVKIGMELFYGEGPHMVRMLKERGHQVFLDLKLHDIPNTVRRSMSVLRSLGVDMCNVHAAGAREMMEAAREGLGGEAKLIAVTQLTSTGPETLKNELLIGETMERTVMHYAQNAAKAGLDGVVCSPWEAAAVHGVCGDSFLTVTPGVRFAGGDVGDQKRIMTPEKAKEAGSNYIVVGRPITAAADPLEAYVKCLQAFVD